MKNRSATWTPDQLPAKAQNGVFAFLFNLIDLLAQIFSLFGLFQDFFGPDEEEEETV